MANREKTSSPEIHCVFVKTSLDTCLALPLNQDEITSDFKDKLCKEHRQVFPEIGDINVSALKVKRRRKFYHFSESMNVCKAFDGISGNWFMYADAVRVEKGEVLTADEKHSNLELVEKKKELAIGSVFVDGHTKDLILEEGLETQVVEKKTKKRKIRSSDGKTSRKKSKVDLNQSAVDTTELCGKVQGEVASQSCALSPREKLDDLLPGAIGKDIESGEKNGVSTGESQQTSDVDKLLEEKILTVNSELVDGHTKGVVKDVPDNQTVKETLEKLDDLAGAKEQDLEKGGKTADIVMIDQEKDLSPASELVVGQITSQDDERGEGGRLAPSAVDNLQTAEMVTYAENQLEASSGLTTGPATKKKRKRTKSSKDHINQSTAAATTTSRNTVNEITEVPENVDCVDVTSKSCPISEREILGNPLVDAVQKETEMGEAKSVKSTKKKSSKKSKTPAKEGTLVDSGAQNVEPIKVLDGEGPEKIIRNVLDSLQQRNEAEENLDKSGKKSSKRLKKKDSLNIVEEAQEMSVEVNNAAQDEASPINNPKDSDASFTPAKKNTENKIIELAHNTEDINRSMQTLKENADMGDTFGSSQKDNIVGGGNKQDQVAGGAKSKKEKKSLDLHPGGSIDGAMKPKERKGRVQPSRSGTSQLQSKDKNDLSGAKVDHSDASMKAALNNKKEALKKSSNSATVNKSKMNIDNKNTIQYHSLSVICGLPASSVTANKSKMNFFKDAEKWNSAEDKSKTTLHVSTKTPLDISSGDVCDVTSSTSRKQGNNVAGGTNKFSGSLRYNF